MRLIAFGPLRDYMTAHPETAPSLTRWHTTVKQASWATMSEVQYAFQKAKVLNAERVRFEIAGGNYRLIVAFDFEKQIVFVKFIGTHADYNKINALTVSLF